MNDDWWMLTHEWIDGWLMSSYRVCPCNLTHYKSAHNWFGYASVATKHTQRSSITVTDNWNNQFRELWFEKAEIPDRNNNIAQWHFPFIRTIWHMYVLYVRFDTYVSVFTANRERSQNFLAKVLPVTFIQSYLVFNNVFLTLAEKHYLAFTLFKLCFHILRFSWT